MEKEHFSRGICGDLDIAQTLEYYRKRYVDQIKNFTDLDKNYVIADIGTDHSWLAMAFVAFSPVQVIVVNADEKHLNAGREIAEVLGLVDRIEWHTGLLGQLELGYHCAGIVYCIEALEHVYGDRSAIKGLSRLARHLVMLTTPNAWFPAITHDTRLPFCHLLPVSLRLPYVKVFNRADRKNDNIIFSTRDVRKTMNDFKIVSKFLHYKSKQDYLDTYPLYLPYRGGGDIDGIGGAKGAYYQLASLLGSTSQYILPNIACVMKRRSNLQKD